MANAEFYIAFEPKSKAYFLVSDSCLISQDQNNCKIKLKRATLDCLILFCGIY